MGTRSNSMPNCILRDLREKWTKTVAALKRRPSLPAQLPCTSDDADASAVRPPPPPFRQRIPVRPPSPFRRRIPVRPPSPFRRRISHNVEAVNRQQPMLYQPTDVDGDSKRSKYRMSRSYDCLDDALDMEDLEHRPQPRIKLHRVMSRKLSRRLSRTYAITRSLEDLQFIGDDPEVAADSREVLCGSSRTLSGLASTEEDLSQDSVEEHSSSEEYTVNTESDEECLDKEDKIHDQTKDSFGSIELVVGAKVPCKCISLDTCPHSGSWRGEVTADCHMRLFSNGTEIHQSAVDNALSEDQMKKVCSMKECVVFDRNT